MIVVGKNIIVNLEEQKVKENISGLLLGEKQREDVRYHKALVKSVGEEVKVVKSDDTIYFDRHSGFNLDIDNTTYKVIQEKDVVIIL
jgi:co-chaperonin GroES (HSP10)